MMKSVAHRLQAAEGQQLCGMSAACIVQGMHCCIQWWPWRIALGYVCDYSNTPTADDAEVRPKVDERYT